jgi:Fe/S biogenesis protein NfuA
MSDSKVLTIPDEAVQMILDLARRESDEEEYGLLIEVTGLRGADFQYELTFSPVADAGDDLRLERHGGLAVMIPIGDIEKLQGSTLSLTDQGLAMDNPNSPASPGMRPPAPGTLTGPLVDQVQQVLDEQVNPAIAAHGGSAELVSVDGTIAYLRLGGGCQGCGMAAVTLRQGIERILMESIAELTEVVDVTDHAAGESPYYEPSKK